ncbi:uncharacterized protein EI90DRAFT_507357 [Cantharellus anzutake]|uniref:uncharacterized protein n=1 Tax=Cantharellus anzutake TaxID=1750568 RepID=UPI001907A1EE|nr:uncharacterized protein EI90DRAFT_507357 [Cantharellus anzutake]KAF8334108.1 hypothetical protein EI90DRAFT_507357 [Cantharellus anzutake]
MDVLLIYEESWGPTPTKLLLINFLLPWHLDPQLALWLLNNGCLRYMTDLTFEFRKQDSPERYQREARLHKFRYNGLTKWYVPEIIAHCVANCLAALLGEAYSLSVCDLDLYTSILVLAITGAFFIFYLRWIHDFSFYIQERSSGRTARSRHCRKDIPQQMEGVGTTEGSLPLMILE